MFAQGAAKIFIKPITKRTKTKVGQTANAWSDLLRCPWGRLDYASNDLPHCIRLHEQPNPSFTRHLQHSSVSG
jgi:hypothetical protein